MSKTETTSINISDLNVKLYIDPSNFPEDLKTPLSQTYDPESLYAMSGVAIGEALKPVYDKIALVSGSVDQEYSPLSKYAQSGIDVSQAIDAVEERINEFDDAIVTCNDAARKAKESADKAAVSASKALTSEQTINNQFSALRAEAEKAAKSAAEAAESLRLVTETLAINENDDYLIFNKGLTQFSYRLQYAEDCKYLMAGKLIKDCTMSLPSATNCSNMFQSCGALQTVNLELPSATNCSKMLQYLGALQSANLNLPSATNCDFILTDSYNIVSSVLNAPLSTRFNEAYTRCSLLMEWDGDLSSAIVCTSMFHGCRLNLRSVRNIARTIRDLAAENNTGSITIGMTKNIKGTEELATALAAIRAKGWTVTEQYV